VFCEEHSGYKPARAIQRQSSSPGATRFDQRIEGFALLSRAAFRSREFHLQISTVQRSATAEGVGVNHESLGLSAARSKAEAGGIELICDLINRRCDRLIDINELIKLTGDSRSGAYSKMSKASDAYDADHPIGVRLGRKSVRYRLSEVLAYIASRPRVRDIRSEREVV
jgi:predicted DNA-binding transcriptional regulator AlpA